MLGWVLAEAEQLDHLTRNLNWIPEFMKDMTPGQRLSLLFPVAYLLGSIPFGMVVGRWKGIDVTRQGSGNIGATNVGRLLGKKYFYIVFFLDLFKGLLPVLAAHFLLVDVRRDSNGFLPANIYLLWLAIGFASIGGHMFSVFMKFKGGKGIATSLGVMLGLFPYFTLPAVPVFFIWLIVFKATRYVSLASIIGAVSFPIVYLIVGYARGWPVFREQLPLTIFAFVVAALIVIKHRGNIRRLREGREPHYHPAKHRSSSSQPAQAN